MNEWWSEPVRVEIGTGTALNVNNSVQAARLLLEEWPHKGPKALRARAAILKALERPDDPEVLDAAREAFVAAAGEAKILLGARPKSMAPPGFKSPPWRKRKR